MFLMMSNIFREGRQLRHFSRWCGFACGGWGILLNEFAYVKNGSDETSPAGSVCTNCDTRPCRQHAGTKYWEIIEKDRVSTNMAWSTCRTNQNCDEFLWAPPSTRPHLVRRWLALRRASGILERESARLFRTIQIQRTSNLCNRAEQPLPYGFRGKPQAHHNLK